MVRLAHGDHAGLAGGADGKAQAQVDSLGAGVDQEHRVQWVGQQGGEAFGELHHRGVVEPRVGVQPPQLPGRRLFDAGVGVAQWGDVVDDVEVGAAFGGQQVVAPTPFDTGRGGVVVLLHCREHGAAPLQQVGPLRAVGGGQAQQRGGVGGEWQPAGGVLGTHQGWDVRAAGRAQCEARPAPGGEVDEVVARPDRCTGGDHRCAGREGRRQDESAVGDLHESRPCGEDLPRTGGLEHLRPAEPHVDAGGNGRAGHRRQGRGTAQPRLCVPGGCRGRAVRERGGRVRLLGVGVEPGSPVHGIGVRGQVQYGDVVGGDAAQEGEFRDVGCDRGVGVSDRVPDEPGHHR